MNVWKYRWVSPDPKAWSSFFTFDSFEEARDSAIWHARNARKRKHYSHIELEKMQTKLVWRSLRKAGWRIRRKRFQVENE